MAMKLDIGAGEACETQCCCADARGGGIPENARGLKKRHASKSDKNNGRKLFLTDLTE